MKIIANPQAGCGRGIQYLERIKKILKRERLAYQIRKTEFPGHARRLVEEFTAGGCSRLVVMGGDGTIGEVLNGVLKAGVELGVISVGTGNDIARSFGLPFNDPEAALETLLSGRVAAVDVGLDGGRCFLSVLGVGFPAAVVKEAEKLRRPMGRAAFLGGAYKALHRMEAIPLEIILDERRLELECTAVLVHNTPFTGGGLKIAPEAKYDDGLFDVVVIESISKLDLMLNLPRVYWGRHIHHQKFSLYRSRSVRVHSRRPLIKISDGEIVGGLPVESRVLHRALKIVLPAGKRKASLVGWRTEDT